MSSDYNPFRLGQGERKGCDGWLQMAIHRGWQRFMRARPHLARLRETWIVGADHIEDEAALYEWARKWTHGRTIFQRKPRYDMDTPSGGQWER